MDVIHLLQKVKNIDDYINVTHEISDPRKDFELHLNQETVHTLKQVKAFEIEHLHKSYGNGAATIIITRLLKIPPGRAWVVVGRQLVIILRYWLDAIRKHLINHLTNWWSFLQLILKFINCILNKDEKKDARGPTIGNMLAELTAECLFDLATNDKTDLHQKYEILHCLNKFGAVCSREVRNAKQEDLDRMYFSCVGGLVWDSGYAPLQQVALEALLRWLVRRTCPTTRAEAAARWFPPPCPQAARDVFTNNTWSRNFLEDSKQFLNTLNDFNGRVTSVVCKKLFFGETMFITGTERYRIWVDMNVSDKSVTVQLPGRVLRSDASETLRLHHTNAARAHLTRASEEIKLVVYTHKPIPLIPSNTILKDDRLITFVVGSTNLVKFDQALRLIFEDKYQVYMDLTTKTLPLTPPMPKEIRMSSDEDSRFSIPAENIRHTFGQAVPSKHSGLATPSSVSSSSLAQLHEKLEALPHTNPFAKDTPVVKLRPQLSSVTETSEFDERSFHSMSTLKLGQPSLYKNLCLKKKNVETNKIPLSSVNKDNIPITQSTQSDDSVINDSIPNTNPNDEIQNSNEPLDPKMVDQLVKEALNLSDIDAEFIDNTPTSKVKTAPKLKSPVKPLPKKVCTVLSATDEESNTDVFNDNPMFPNARKGKFGKLLRKQYASKDSKKEKPKTDTIEVNSKVPVVLVEKLEIKSPDVNKKKDIIKDQAFEHDENDVLECLNSLITKVCDDMNKCIMYLDSDQQQNDTNKKTVTAKKQKEKKTIKLKFNPPKTKKVKKGKGNVNEDTSNENIEEKIVTKGRKKHAINKPVENEMNVIIEEDISASSFTKPTSASVKTTDETLIRRRRKLYSPERNDLEQRNSPISDPKEPVISSEDSETPLIKRKKRLYSSNRGLEDITVNKEDDDAPLSTYEAKKIKTTSSIYDRTVYGDLEKERKNRPKRSLTKKRGNTDEPPSPRTVKMNAAFENLKSLESNENIVFAETNKATVYNFSSDSDSNNDFKHTKLQRTSSSTGKKYTKAKQNARADKNVKSQRKRKTPVKTRSKNNLKIEPSRDLIDEKMREAKPLASNTTVVEVHDEPKTRKPNLEPKLKDKPQMEFIQEVHPKDRNKKKNKLVTPALVEDEDNVQDIDDKDTNRTFSPLPTLMIESVSNKIPQDDTFNLSNMSNLKRLLKNADNPNADISNNTQNAILDMDVDEEIMEKNKENTPKEARKDIKRHSKQINKIEKKISNTHTDMNKFTDIDEEFIEEYNENKEDNVKTEIKRRPKKLNKIEKKNVNELQDKDNFIDVGEEIIEEYNENREEKVKTEINRRSKQINKIEKKNVNELQDKDKFMDVDEEIIEEYNENRSEKANTQLKWCSKQIKKIKKNANAQNPKNEDFKINNSGNTITDGITAHGEMDEDPPNTQTLEKSDQPRELDDYDDSSLKDYYVKINKEINKDLEEKRSKSKETSSPEAVVLLQRLSPEDITRFLPSLNSSETDNSIRHSEPMSIRSQVVSRPAFKDLRLIIPSSSKANSTRKLTETIKSKPKENSSKHEYETRVKNKIVKNKSSPKRRLIRSSIESVRESIKHKSIRDRNSDIGITERKDRSISSKIQTPNEKSDNSTKSGTKASKTETCVCTSAFSRAKESRHSIQGTFNAISAIENEKALQGTFNATIVFQKEKTMKDLETSSMSESYEDGPVLTKKVFASGLTTESISSSSVTEWLSRINEPSTSKENDPRLLVKDTLRGVMEKLDTTLPESNLNTSKKLGNLFVEIQRKLKTMEEEETQRSNEFIAKLDNINCELENLKSEFIHSTNASRERTTELMKNLKKQGFEVLREDCKQKRALVAILKEDIQAVINHLNKGH